MPELLLITKPLSPYTFGEVVLYQIELRMFDPPERSAGGEFRKDSLVQDE